jgi:hypothetical protein
MKRFFEDFSKAFEEEQQEEGNQKLLIFNLSSSISLSALIMKKYDFNRYY